jgi:hypothetical protein
VVVAVLVGLLAAVMARGNDVSGPPWSGNLRDCRANPMEHVHDPGRLTLVDRCSSVTGTVRSVRFVPAFDDLRIEIVPERTVRKYLRPANRGVVVADVIATDQADLHVPVKGSRISAWGAWVIDKATKAAMLLPAYRIAVIHADDTVIHGESQELHGPPLPKRLKLQAAAPRRVAVGGWITVIIRAQWVYIGTPTPASEVRLFAEMTEPDGTGVRWKAAMTNTLGVATLHMVAIQVPGTYILTLYAAPSQQPVTARVVIQVARR